MESESNPQVDQDKELARVLRSRELHRKRVRVNFVDEEEYLSVEGHELKKRIGKEGICDCKNFDGDFISFISVLFDDGNRLRCWPEILEVVVSTASHASDGQELSTVEVPALSARYVQACIAHVSFPNSLEELQGIVLKDGETNMEYLLWPEADGDWTVPRWMTTGDILFFYHTKNAETRIKRLYNDANDPENIEWRKVADRERVVDRLSEQYTIAQDYGGTIFACAIVTDTASVWSDDVLGRKASRHWKGNIHAPIARVYNFARPVPDYGFNAFVKISQGAFTPLHGSAFTHLKNLLDRTSELPDYLSSAVAGGVSFRDVNSSNWLEISCSPSARYIDESQLRSYLLDYLLEALKDPKTTVHEECCCKHGDRSDTYADYCVKIGGHWIAVEAKLNVRAESNLPGQISTYLRIPEFCPSRGSRARETIIGPTAPVCLVVDQTGIYFVDHDGYLGCNPGKPIWPLTVLSNTILNGIKSRLLAVI